MYHTLLYATELAMSALNTNDIEGARNSLEQGYAKLDELCDNPATPTRDDVLRVTRNLFELVRSEPPEELGAI